MSMESGTFIISHEGSSKSIDEGLPRDLSQLSLSNSSSSDDDILFEKKHLITAMKQIYNYFQNEKLCDVVLIAGDHRIPVHKIILSACSEYFSVMFMGSLREASQREIKLENVDGNALQTLIKYCYTGRIELKEESVEVLLSTASLLQLHGVTNACCEFLKQQLDPCNCLGIASFAEQQACLDLHRDAIEYTYKNYVNVTKNQEFLSLPIDQLIALLKSDDLNVPNEESVFESLMLWVEHDHTSRIDNLPQLIELVKLPLLRSDYLLDRVEAYCASIPKCQQLIMESVKWHLLPERRPQLSSHRTRPRTSTIGHLLCVGGVDGSKSANCMALYDPRANTWAQFLRMSARRMQFGVAVVQNKLIIVGGRNGLKTLNTAECLDLTSMQVTQLAPMNSHRHGLGLAVVGDGPGAALYAIGGHDGWIYLNTVERWDPAARSWSLVCAMASARSTCGAVSLNGRLYAVGGRDSLQCLRTVEVYSPSTDRWSSCAPMIKRRSSVSISVSGGYIYAFGGQEAPASYLSCIERYDPIADEWSIVARLSSPRDSIGSCTFGDRIAIIGGYDGREYLNSVELYEPTANVWKSLAPLPLGRAGAAIVLIKPK